MSQPSGGYRGRALVAVAASVLGTAVTGTAGDAPGQCLQNPGFERWQADRPEGWQTDGKQQVTRARGSGNVHRGQSAVRLRAVRSGKYFVAGIHQDKQLRLKRDTVYVASVWARGSGRLRLVLQEYRRKGYLGGRSSLHADLTPQWREYRFVYGTEGDTVQSVRFDLSLDGKGAEAWLDEASLRELGPRPRPSDNVVPNGTMEADTDRDGRPDHWCTSQLGSAVIGGAELKDAAVGVGPDGSRAIVGSCRLPQPTQRRPFEPKTWWDWRQRARPAGPWVTPVSSPFFPIEPGRTYHISFQCRGQNVRGYHVKLRWMKTRAEQVRWFTIGPRQGGTWDWTQVDLSLTAPSAGVQAARLEWWCTAGAGRLWVDNVIVRKLSGRPVGWAVLTYKVKALAPSRTADAVPAVPVRQRAERRTVRFQERPKTRVVERPDGVEIALRNGLTLQLRRQGRDVYGIGQVRLGDCPWRHADAPPVAPLFDTRTGVKYTACHYRGCEQTPDGQVVIHTELVSASGPPDRLDWIVAPVDQRIARLRYVGFSYQYRFRSARQKVDQVLDRATWELGGQSHGLTLAVYSGGAIDSQFPLGPDTGYYSGGGVRFAGCDGMDYQYGPSGALAVYYDQPIAHVRTQRWATPTWINLHDAVQYAGLSTLTTPRKCVVWASRGDRDRWARVHDWVYQRHAGFWRIQPQQPEPIVNCWLGWKELGKHGDRILYDIAKLAPRLGRMGFKVLAIHSVWGRGACSPDRIEVGEQFGGPKALRHLCDAAKRHGMIVQAWAAAAHLWQHAPILKKNPDWLIQGPKGQPPTRYCYPGIRGVRFAAGYADYALRQFREVRDQTGLASLWVDSYSNFTHGIQCADRRVLLEQGAGLLKFHGALTRMGYRIYTECAASLGITSCGLPASNLDSAHPLLPDPSGRYGMSNYVGPWIEQKEIALNRAVCRGDHYYRMLANKGPCMIYWYRFATTPGAHAKIARANHDYNAVVADMQWRRTLSRDRGVGWTNSRNARRIVFSYAASTYRCPPGAAVRDVTSGKPIVLSNGTFQTMPSHTYRITGAAPSGGR